MEFAIMEKIVHLVLLIVVRVGVEEKVMDGRLRMENKKSQMRKCS